MSELLFDSGSEALFHEWALELKEAGLIKSIELQPKFDDIIPKHKINKHIAKKKGNIVEPWVLLDSLSYTPDFKIIWDLKAEGVLFRPIENFWHRPVYFFSQLNQSGENVSIIEVKETNIHGNITAAVLKQKILFHLKGVYVNMTKMFIGRDALFKNTFQPESLSLKIKNGKRKKKCFKDWKERKIDDFLKEHFNELC